MQGHIKRDFCLYSSNNNSADSCSHGGAGGASLVPLGLSSASYQPHAACGHKAEGEGDTDPVGKRGVSKKKVFLRALMFPMRRFLPYWAEKLCSGTLVRKGHQRGGGKGKQRDPGRA